ncbi:hypothetical protein [Thaumasiovibrio subtropicus]|uniref:hypothetical protein n=1 Tax=Thaumasiovibrio subtropicus TaxID=1891207 RepID=UPI000B354882|nr:hypothetical protein [Thaumasiovibrio subtropicus]
MKITFLHTVDSNIGHFQPYLAQRSDILATHKVMPELLHNIGRDGFLPKHIQATQAAIQSLATAETDLVVCTCSTLGDIAENTAVGPSTTVIRVDRQLAIDTQPFSRVAVIVAAPSTLTPTKQLFTRLNTHSQIDFVLCDDAWNHFLKGNTQAYYHAVAETLNRQQQRHDIDAIALAQLSMIPAITQSNESKIPLLHSVKSFMNSKMVNPK